MRNLTIEELKQIAGGAPGEGELHSQSSKNNGWGNGADGTNNGSFSGGTEPSKEDNTADGAEGTPNNNLNFDTR